jgi:hypothetical protein
MKQDSDIKEKASTGSQVHMKVLLSLLVVFVVLDGLLTRFLIDGGLAREGNPLLQRLVGENAFIIIKVIGALLCALILWDIHKRFPRLAKVATWCCVVFYGAVVIWNSSFLL